MGRKVVSVSLSEDEAASLYGLANEAGVSLSQLLRVWIAAYSRRRDIDYEARDMAITDLERRKRERRASNVT